MDDDDIIDGLKEFLAEELDDASDIRLEDFVQHAEGWSDHTYTFELRYRRNGQEHSKPWAVRKFVPGGVIRSYMLDLEQHYRILEALESSPFPSPAVQWLVTDESYLGSPFFFMEQLDGHVPVPWSKEGREFLKDMGENEETCRQIVENLAHLHKFNWRDHDLDNVLEAPEPGLDVPTKMIQIMEDLLERNRIGAQPVIREAYGWLRENKIPSQQVCLTHGDYRPGNFLFKDGDITGVLDLETAKLTDPMYDVAWVVAKPNRMGSDKCYYMFDRDWFFEKYEELTGWEINPKRVKFYEIIHQLRLCANWYSGAKGFIEGENDDLRHVRGYFSIPVVTDQLADLLDF